MKNTFAFFRLTVLLLIIVTTVVGPLVISYFRIADATLWRKHYSTVANDKSGQLCMFASGTRVSFFSSQHNAIFGVLPSNYDPATMFLDAPEACPQPHLLDIAKFETPRFRQRTSKVGVQIVGLDAGFPFRIVGGISFQRVREGGFDPTEYRPASTLWRRWYSSEELKKIKNYIEPRDHLYWWSPLALAFNLLFWIGFAFVLFNAKNWFIALRSLLRIRRGLCHACCYDVSGLRLDKKCPECGVALRYAQTSKGVKIS